MQTPVRQLWGAMARRDWEAVKAVLSEGFVARWPNTGETFTRDEFVLVNAQYPGEWKIEIRDLFDCGAAVISVVEVSNDGSRFFATSVFGVEGGLIDSLTEYWSECAPPPEWRRDLLTSHRDSGGRRRP